MTEQLNQLKQDFTEGLSQISKFWGFPKGMGAIFAVLYLSPAPLSLNVTMQLCVTISSAAIDDDLQILSLSLCYSKQLI